MTSRVRGLCSIRATGRPSCRVDRRCSPRELRGLDKELRNLLKRIRASLSDTRLSSNDWDIANEVEDRIAHGEDVLDRALIIPRNWNGAKELDATQRRRTRGVARPSRSVTEEELMLGEEAGTGRVRATVVWARERRRRTGLERFGHIQRIADAYGHERIGVLEDVRLRLLREVLGDVDDAVWRDALDAVRHQLLEDVERETWEQARVERLRTAYRDSFECEQVDHEGIEEALFLQDRDAICGMSLDRKEAVTRARAHLAGEGSTLAVAEDRAHPNPYQDLWLVESFNPEDPDDELDGGGEIVVPALGPVYELGSLPARPGEFIGAIWPVPEEE